MEAIILGSPYDIVQGSVVPITVPAYEAEEAVIQLSDGYNPYIIGTTSADSYWFRYPTGLLRPLTISDSVVIGGSSIGDELLRIYGKTRSQELELSNGIIVENILDEDDMSSDSAVALATQQSIKAYVDAQVGGYLQSGDNISELVNDSGYISSESDPIFIASAAGGIDGTDITNWDTAYSWGDHALVGYLTAESDPLFVASSAFSITGTNITNWNTAYTNNHTHSNISVLDIITNAGAGTQALFNDGTYKTVAAVSGSNTYVQFNNSGTSLGSDSTFTFNSSTKLLSVTDIIASSQVFVGDSSTYLDIDGSNNLRFTDAVSGSVTLASILGGATNYWTTTTGGIYYGAGTDMVGINTSTLTAELTVVGHIIADDFDSNYMRVDVSDNILIGLNITPTGSDKLYIDNNALGTASTYPLIYGDFANSLLLFNAQLTLNGTLNFESSNQQIFAESGSIYVKDTSTELSAGLKLSSFVDGTYNALKSEFTAYNSVRAITAANVSEWNTAYSQRHVHADNILDWNATTGYYEPYVAKQGTTLSFDVSGDTPTGTTRINLNGDLHTTTLNVAGKLTVGGLIDPTGLQLTPIATNPGDTHTIWEDSDDSLLKYGSNTIFTGTFANGLTSASNVVGLGGSLTGNTFITTTTYDLEISTSSTGNINIVGSSAAFNCADDSIYIEANSSRFSIDNTGAAVFTDGSLALTGITYFADYSGTYTDRSLVDKGYVDSVAGVIPTDDILDWSTDKYIPYATQQVFLSFDTSNDDPNDTDRLNLNGALHSTLLYATTEIHSPNFYGGAFVGTGISINQPETTRGIGIQTITTPSDNITEDCLWVSRTSSSHTYNYTGNLINIIDNPTTSGTISGKILTATIGSTERISFNPRVTDGASAVAYMIDTHNALSTAGAKLWSFRNQGTEECFIDLNGQYENTTAGNGIILKSPDGTRYRLTIANGGTVVVTAL